MDQLHTLNFSNGFNFYWFYYAGGLPVAVR